MRAGYDTLEDLVADETRPITGPSQAVRQTAQRFEFHTGVDTEIRLPFKRTTSTAW